jgi:hypothetical protein
VLTPAAQNLLVEGVKWLIVVIAEAAKGEPPPTQVELETRVQAALSGRAPWLPAALDHSDHVYEAGE